MDLLKNDGVQTLYDINIIFKICSSEIFQLFKSIYDINTGNIINKNYNYNSLPKEYKYILYKIRGIIFKNKKSLKINDIYILLKRIPTIYFISLLKVRSNFKHLFDYEYIKKYYIDLHIKLYDNFLINL